MDITPLPRLAVGTAHPPETLRRTAQALETAFLAEMLQAAGINRSPDGFDGGTGEAQFASFMAEAQARAMVAAGGLGLTEAIMASLARRDAGAGA